MIVRLIGTSLDERPATTSSSAHGVSFAEASRAWLTIGLLSFGGPVGQIAVMHRIIVDEKKWISERRFLHGLNFCMLLPGPEAMQLATYMGWLLHRTLGGIVAGLLFVLPGALVMLGLSILYVTSRDAPLVAGALWGLKPAVLAIVLVSLIRLARRTLHGGIRIAIALASFILFAILNVPFPLVLLFAALVGSIARLHPADARPHITTSTGDSPAHLAPAAPLAPIDRAIEAGALSHTRVHWPRTLLQLLLGAALALAPLLILLATRGPDSTLTRQTAFYSQASVMTFGGAYALLSYVAQHVVHTNSWISTREMMDGLGLAETTPGPLILVVQFTAFLAGHHHPESLSPLASAILSSLLVLWVTFVPSFVFVLAGGPYVEHLLRVRWLNGALAGITPAVLGVILNLALMFAAHALFTASHPHTFRGLSLNLPAWSTIDPLAAALAALSLVIMLSIKRGMLIALFLCAAAGMLLHPIPPV